MFCTLSQNHQHFFENKILWKNNLCSRKKIIWRSQKWQLDFSRPKGSYVIDQNNILLVFINISLDLLKLFNAIFEFIRQFASCTKSPNSDSDLVWGAFTEKHHFFSTCYPKTLCSSKKYHQKTHFFLRNQNFQNLFTQRQVSIILNDSLFFYLNDPYF